jgi:hypothetical protein
MLKIFNTDRKELGVALWGVACYNNFRNAKEVPGV